MDRGPVQSRDFGAHDIVLFRVPECTRNVDETVKTVCSKRGRILGGDVKVSGRNYYSCVFYRPVVTREVRP